jgi:hypothetical protein
MIEELCWGPSEKAIGDVGGTTMEKTMNFERVKAALLVIGSFSALILSFVAGCLLRKALIM